MDSAFENLQRDTNATIKAILSEMEYLAQLPPEQAMHPEVFSECRKRVVKRLWALSRRCMIAGEE